MKNDDSFSKQIDDVLSGKYNRFDALKVCDTPRIFLDAGLQQLPILYTQNHLKDALHEKSADKPHWHGLSIEQIKKVPKLLESPVLLMDSLNNDDSIVAVLSLLDNDNAPVFATIKPNGNGIYNSHKTDSNFMLSIYGKEKGFEYYIKRAAEENKILYWNKEKSQEIQCAELLMAQGLDSLDSNKILHQTNSLVNKTTSTLVIDSNQAARIKAAREIKENMPNLSENERAAAVAILEAGAKSQKMSISEYMEKTFPNGIFGDIKKAENAAKQQGVEINGAVSINGFGENAKAVIYAGKTADFSTWCHELSHVWQSQLTGELKQNAEEAFQVKNSDWQNSVYTFEDGHTDTSAEAFAYGFEDFLKHKAGEMSTEEKKKIFEKFADYMSRTYNGVKQHIKINEKITAVYQKLIDLDDNILAQAEKAVREESENEFLQREKNIQHSERREDYIKKYYTNIKNQYYETEQISSDGKRKGIIEVSNDRNLNNKTTRTEIDALLTFTDMGAYATLLSESPSIGDEKHIDALLNHRTLVEIKSPTGNANSIAKEIKEAINKENSELVTVFLLDSAKNVSDDEILEKLEQKRKFIHGNTDGIFVIRNGIISEIKIPRVESFQTRSPSNSNNITNAKNVNISFQPVDSSTLFQFQIIGELGARELDSNAESNERIANLKMSDNTEQTETPKTRSEYLQGKTELSDVDIINILDLPVEKINENNIQVYTQKSFVEIKNNSIELETLAENLKTNGEYLKYRSTFIAKSKLLYQESSVLCNEIPCMMILDEINEPAYLLPYGYSRENKEDKAFADALKEKNNAFTEFKRVFSEDFSRAYKNAKSQGNEIFICLNDKKSNKSETFRRLKKIVNASHSKNKNCSIVFYAEKEKLYFCYNIDENGIITEKNINQVKKSGLTPLGKPSFAETIPNKINIPSTTQIINPNFHFVNDFYFESLLARGAVTEFARNSKIKNRNIRYLQSLNYLESITKNAPEEILKKSNKIFIQAQKETKFYQALLAEQTENKTDSQEKTMENTLSENISYENEEMSESAAIKERNQQKKLTTQMILDQEDKEQMENISATMKSATKDFMDLNATPITENPFKNAEPDQTKELYEQAESVEKMQQEAAENAVLDENENTHYQTDEELLQEYKQKYPESSLSISEDTRTGLENVFSQIDDYLDKGIVPQESRFTLPKVPPYLKELGSDETAISLPVSVIKKARETHGLSNEEIKKSLTRLYDPVAVFDTDKTKSENKLDSKLILTDEFSESKPIALALNTNTQIQVEEDGHRKLIEVQDIRSIHDRTLTAKNGTDLVKHWTENGLCRYVDDKKISEWSTVARVSFPIEALHSDKNNILIKSEVVNSHNSDSVKQEENPSVQMEPRLMKKFDEMKKAIENREKQEEQTAAEKTESAGSKKAESHEKAKVDLIKKAAKDFISAIKNGTAPFLNTTENDFGKILLHPAAIVNASNGLPFSGEAQLLAQIYHQQQKMEGEIVTTFEGAKESGTFIADKPESKKNFVLANKTEQQQKEIIQKTRYFMPEACSEPDKIYAHALQMQRPQKISDYRDLIRHFENIPNGQKEISDLRIRIAHEHLKEIQSRFALKEKRILTVDEINERKKILQDYFKSLPEKHRESEKSAFENTFGLTLNPEEVFKTNLEGNFKNKKFEDVVKSNEKLTDQANRRLSSFIQNNSMEDKKLSEILHEEYNEQLKDEKSTSKKLKIEAKGITEPETYLGKYLAACSSNAEFVTDEDTIKAVQANLVKKLEENYRLEKYGILKEIGQQAQKISNETTSKIAFDKAHSNKNIKEKNIAKEIGPVGMGN